MPWRWNLSEYIKIPSTLAEKWNKPRRNNLYTLRWYISVGFLFGYYNSYFDFYPIISSPVTSIWFYSPVFLLHIIHYCSSLYCIHKSSLGMISKNMQKHIETLLKEKCINGFWKVWQNTWILLPVWYVLRIYVCLNLNLAT